MMDVPGFFTREGLAAWIEGLASEMPVYAPSLEGGVLLYKPVVGGAEPVWEFSRPVLPVKTFFFPPTEHLLSIEKTGQQVRLTEKLPEGSQVIFGVRPCDARGVKIMDALFLEADPVDPYYARRRENTTLIGLACETMGESCFCTSLGSGPDDARDVDLMLTPVEGGYWVEAVTEKGKNLARELKTNDESRKPKTREAYSPSLLQQSAQRSPVHIPEQAAWPARFSDEYWERMAERCISCRTCAYVCPTCRCFDIRDEVLAAGHVPSEMDPAVTELLYEHDLPSVSYYERIRCWDSCAGQSYRRIAGGHNPRAAKGQRLRNRFFCKFYYYPLQVRLDSAACTGCGRCIDYCPAGVDLVEVLDYVAAAHI